MSESSPSVLVPPHPNDPADPNRCACHDEVTIRSLGDGRARLRFSVQVPMPLYDRLRRLARQEQISMENLFERALRAGLENYPAESIAP